VGTAKRTRVVSQFEFFPFDWGLGIAASVAHIVPMAVSDEHGRPIIHSGPPDIRNERERWIINLDPRGVPECLIQEYETPNALQSGASYVRPGRIVPAEEFYTAELPDEVRRKLYKFIEKLDA
jgi:hypothetical protein